MGKTTRSVSHVEDEHDTSIDTIVNVALAKKEEVFEKLLQVQQSTFQACIQSFVEATNIVRNTAKELAELRASVQYTQKEMDDIKLAVKSQSEQLSFNMRSIDTAKIRRAETT